MAKLKKKSILIIFIFFSIFLMSSCWDNIDLTEKAFVTAVAIDKTSDNKIELTLQIVKPTVLVSDKPKNSEEAIWVFSSSGDTIFEAAKNQMTTVNRQPFYNHAHLLVIGEKFARDGIKEALDFWERNHEPRLGADIIIAKDTTAKKILNTKSDLQEIPSMHITGILQNNKSLAKIKKVTIIDVLKQLMRPGQNPVIGTIQVKNEKEVMKIKDLKVEGSAVFKGDKLIGWLDSKQTKGLLFIQDEVKTGIVNVVNPFDKNKKIAIEISHSKGKIDAKLNDGKLSFIIDIKVTSNIADQQGNADLSSQEILKTLAQETEKAIKKNIEEVLDTALNKYKSDIFGFSEIVYKKYLDYWNQNKDNWNDIFRYVPIEINVKVNIKSAGIISKTTKVK